MKSRLWLACAVVVMTALFLFSDHVPWLGGAGVVLDPEADKRTADEVSLVPPDSVAKAAHVVQPEDTRIRQGASPASDLHPTGAPEALGENVLAVAEAQPEAQSEVESGSQLHRFRILSESGGASIAKARLSLRPSAGADGDAAERELVFFSDSNGDVVAGPLAAGSWALEVLAAEHERWTDEYVVAEASGLDLPAGDVQAKKVIRLRSVVSVEFELIGVESWSDPSGFSIESLEAREPVPVDDAGRASLTYAELPDALFVRVNYPGGAESWEKFARREVDPEQPCQILVGGERGVEVEVVLSTKTRKALVGVEAYVRATFIDEKGAVRFVAQPHTSKSVYSFPQVQADTVNVGLVSAGDGQQVEWVAETHELQANGVTAILLAVENPPRKLRFVDVAGTPLPGVSWRLMPGEDSTSWMAGGTADTEGVALIPMSMPDGPFYLSVDDDSARWQLFDRLLESPADEEDLVVSLAPRRETSIEFIGVEGAELRGTVRVEGRLTGSLTYPWPVDGEARVGPFQLVDGSNAVAHLDLEGIWTEEASVRLSPGVNRVQVARMGWLTAATLEELKASRSTRFSASVGDWVEAGRVAPEATGGGFRAQVPAGSYSRTAPDGSILQFLVEAAAN